ncbi:hypothetical protein [Streptomyces sudanensis]|uniref:hypothetical protein n=1 Tax=Streptomyces sudanensis TaxID=436397 RepID=UPI0020CE0181|nr:hypothetical protein [Streptomyces sudanensis]MCP9986828.1 hypothetical protein [Streptomyces sudanensis]MCQ0001747.1 hypothetical protein [Streptomyces sudanensis]
MSFGGPQWPQDPHRPGDGSGQDPYGERPRYGDGPRQDTPYGGQEYGARPHEPQPFGQPSASPFGARDDGTPDWGALAEASEARQRRRRWLLAGGGVLATAAVAVLVAVAVVSTDEGAPRAGATEGAATAPPGGAELPTDGTGPQPSFSSVAPPPPPDPMDFISSAARDRAPLDAEGLFPGRKLTFGDRVYAKGPVHSTVDCASAGKDGLGPVLERHGCTRVIRATYTRDGVAVTVGVALFADRSAALGAKEEARGGVAPLAGAGVGDFCRATVCLRRSNALGRYAYFTQAGFTDGRKVTQADTAVFKSSDDLSRFTFSQIHARGRAQASAAATAPADGQ